MIEPKFNIGDKVWTADITRAERVLKRNKNFREW